MQRRPMPVEEALPQIESCLARGRDCRLTVTGTSMLPFLRDQKDAVILSPLTGTVQKGDIIFYLRRQNVCVLHRVYGTLPDGIFSVCGDAQVGLEPVHREQIIGIVTAVEKNGKRIPSNSVWLKMRVSLWQMLYPVRPYAMAVLRKLHII